MSRVIGYHVLGRDWCVDCVLSRLTFLRGMSVEVADTVYYSPEHATVHCAGCEETLGAATRNKEQEVNVDTSITKSNRYNVVGFGTTPTTWGVFDRATAKPLPDHRYRTTEEASAAARRLNGLANVERVAC